MAHYRAVIQGMRGEASRLGSQNSGIDTSVNGWKGGVEVRGRWNGKAQADEFTISATIGSAREGRAHGYIGSVIDGIYTPSGSVKMRIIEEYMQGIANAAANGDRSLQRQHDTKLAEMIQVTVVRRSGGVV